MFLSDLSIKRPVLATVMMLALVTLGVFSYRRLPIDMMPNVDIPVVNIITRFPGASPESVEREVSKVIEEAVNPIAGVKHVYSVSKESVSSVVVEFNLGVEVDDVSQECRTKIAAIRGALPQSIGEPIIQKLDLAADPIISLAVRGEGITPRELTSLVEELVKPRLENVGGVGKIEVVGGVDREVVVEVDPSRLEALNLGVDEVVNGLATENVTTPLGRLTAGDRETSIRMAGKPERVEGFTGMVVARRGSLPVTLGQIARVSDGVEERRSLALVNGRPGIGLNVLKQSGANTVAVVDEVKRRVEALGRELPVGCALEVVRDGSVFIRQSVDDVMETLVIGALLTVLIVFLFLNSWRSTVITGLALPISVVSSFIAMNFLGMTLNTMTLMALSLAIGMLIDDAIVVRENIVRHLELGKDHLTASREGTAEIGLAVLATTLTIIAVFVPVAYMKGIVGKFFYEFGMTVAFAVLVSLFVSFTLDPMLSSRWHDPAVGRHGRRKGLARLLERFNTDFDRTADGYRRVIAWALDHRWLTVALAALAFAGGLVVFGTLEKSFSPKMDRGEFILVFTAAPDASVTETEGRLREVLAVVEAQPETDHTYSSIGAGDAGTVREAKVYVKLKEARSGLRRQQEVADDLRRKLTDVAGIRLSVSDIGMGGMAEKPLSVSIQGDDVTLLKRYAQELKGRLSTVPGIVDLETSLDDDVPEYRLVVDRTAASELGLTSAAISRAVGILVGGSAVTTYEDEKGDAVDVRVRLPEALRGDPSQVLGLRLTVRRTDGTVALVPLSAVARYVRATSPAQIDRRDLARQVTVSASLAGLPIGTAMEKTAAAAAGIAMEPGYRLVFAGEAERMTESFGYMAEALAMAVIFVYLILAAQFESFIVPFSIMLSLPLSVVGLAGMLRLTGDDLSIMSMIGLIMLMGLVTKNAILLVDYALILQQRGKGRREAVVEAGRTRLRPIMMTTLAMIFGMLPMALGLGAAGEMRAPLARGVIGGLITSTVLTLLVVPVVYTLMDDLGTWLKRRWNAGGEVHS